MNLNNILVCITNHNDNDNAISLKSFFSKHVETIIIDSKSDIVSTCFDVKLDNVYYTGLYNESVNQCLLRGKQYLYFIASDVFIDENSNIFEVIESLDDNVNLWAPSSRGQSHTHCKNESSNGMREVPYLEGFTFLVKVDICKQFNIDINHNKFGYGIDLLLGFYCFKLYGRGCYVDDRIEVYHREGTGYDQGVALGEMYKYLLNYSDLSVRDYIHYYSKSPGYLNLLNYLKNNIKDSSISIFLTTIGKPTLSDMLDSLVDQLNVNDYIYIAIDGKEYFDISDKIISNYINKLKCNVNIIYHQTNMGYWGHGLRNEYQSNLKGDYILHGDDDDIYIKGSIERIKKYIKQTDGNSILYFKFYHNYLNNDSFWKIPKVCLNNIGTPCGVIPNKSSNFGTWGYRYGGDFDFYSSCKFGSAFVDENIYVVKPTENGYFNL